MIKTKDIDEHGRIISATVDTETVKDSLAVENCRLVPGDIVISLRGINFKVAIVNEEVRDFVINANLVALSPHPTIKPEIIAFFLRSTIGSQIMQKLATGGSLPSLRIKHLLGIEMFVPPFKKQEELSACIRKLEEYSFLLEEEKRIISQLSDSIVSDLMEGSR